MKLKQVLDTSSPELLPVDVYTLQINQILSLRIIPGQILEFIEKIKEFNWKIKGVTSEPEDSSPIQPSEDRILKLAASWSPYFFPLPHGS